MATVTINAGISAFEIRNPFMNPRITPISRHNANASANGTFRLSSNAADVPDNAMIEPIERSIPAIISANVIPKALIAIIDTCKIIFSILLNSLKLGDKKENTAIRAINPINIPPYILNIFLKFIISI